MKSLKKAGLRVLSAAAMMSMLASTTAFAGQWQKNDSGWWYDNGNGTWPAATWQWIDGNNDGTSECYYFDSNGYMLSNTTTPDGYTVNADGAWTENGVVQIQSISTPVSVTNESSASTAKLGLDKWFVVEQAQNPAVWYGYVDTTPRIKFIWDDDYLGNHPEITNGMLPDEYALKRALEDKNPRYIFYPAGDSGVETMALAEIAGLSRVGNEEFYSLKGYRIDAIKNEVANFLNSFPNWQTASDLEKATRICNWIHKADYDASSDDAYSSYGCLVNKKASCQGYTFAATLLAWVVDIPVANLGSINHAYPVFLVDGVWLANEPTSKNKFFTVANVYLYNPLYESMLVSGLSTEGLSKYQLLGRYCEGTGYTIPSDKSSLSRFGILGEGFGTTTIQFKLEYR